MRELVEAHPHRRRMIVDRLNRFLAPPVNLNEARARCLPDAINASTSKLRLVRHIEQPILEARGAKIRNKNFHGILLECGGLTPPSINRAVGVVLSNRRRSRDEWRAVSSHRTPRD